MCLKGTFSDFENSLSVIDSDLVTPAHDFHLDNSLCLHLDAPEPSTQDSAAQASSSSSAVGIEPAGESVSKKNGKNKITISLKRKREAPCDKMDESVTRAIRKNVLDMKNGKLDLSWNIQDHFDPYFFKLEERYYQHHATLIAKNTKTGVDMCGDMQEASSSARVTHAKGSRKQARPVRSSEKKMLPLK